VSDESGSKERRGVASGGGGVPVDLVAVLVLTLVTLGSVTIPELRSTPLRVVFGLAFVLFAPGYAVVAALFPERNGEGEAETMEELPFGHISGIERIALSLGMCLGIVPLLTLPLVYLPTSFGFVPVSALVGGFTVVACLVAIRRRLAVPVERRFRLPYRRWFRSVRAVASAGPSTDAVVAVALVVSVLVTGVAAVQTLSPAQNEETYTEFYLLSGEEDGVGQATNYTRDLTVGEESSMIVGIGNRDGRPVDYTVVVRLQEVRVEGNETIPAENDRTEERRVSFVPSTRGDQLRLQFLLYRGDAPADPSSETAYRETHLWVSAS
jgi:uncharacterized membrane protein